MMTLKKHWGYLVVVTILLLGTALIYEQWTGITLPRPRLPAEIGQLPSATFFSFARMLAAYVLALLFAIAIGTIAATNRAAGQLLLPALDILQSVPVLGFFPAAIYVFVNLTHGGRLGVELASIFLIFTAMAWNLAFAVYESIAMLPSDLQVVAASYDLKGWRRLQRLYLPVCVPKLVYNTVLSWATGWYFLIASEIIVAGPVHYTLPGLGSFLVHSAEEGSLALLFVGLAVLILIIVLMDTLLWRPLSRWATNFTYEFAGGEEAVAFQPWWTTLRRWPRAKKALRRGAWLLGWRGRRLARERAAVWEWIARTGRNVRESRLARVVWPGVKQAAMVGLLALAIIVAVRAGTAVVSIILKPWPAEARLIPLALAASIARLGVAYLVSLAWTLPVAFWVSNRPTAAQVLTPIAEIAASIPATALFPLMVLVVIRIFGNMNVAAILLLLTGMQWYLLFNLLAGVKVLPNDLKEAARSLNLPPRVTWRRVFLPAMTPSLITGSLTAWGGGWNTLILAEYFVYQQHTYAVLGIGSLLSHATYVTGNGTLIFLALACMTAVVVATNRFFWKPLYASAMERFRLES